MQPFLPAINSPSFTDPSIELHIAVKIHLVRRESTVIGCEVDSDLMPSGLTSGMVVEFSKLDRVSAAIFYTLPKTEAMSEALNPVKGSAVSHETDWD